MIGGGGCRAINLFGGICRIIGRWLEFRLVYVNVVDAYIFGFCVLM